MSDGDDLQFPAGDRAFNSTRWSVVLRAKGEDLGAVSKVAEIRREALGKLIETYWSPLYFFMRRKGFDAEASQDLAQGFFAEFLEKDFLKTVDREKGRFRTFLLVALQHYISNERDKAGAKKRGGGRQILSLDFDDAEKRYQREPSTDETPERLYLRKWARELTQQALCALESEFSGKGKASRFNEIKNYLGGGEDYEGLSERLKMSVANAKVTVHRARKRYAELLRAAVRDTVKSEAEVDGELRELVSSL
jgi:DNA-directed RNA polymerase specialized sigma24 family protein